MKKPLFIYNPGAGDPPDSNERLENAVDHLRHQGLDPEVAVIDSKKKAYKRARKAAKKDCPLVIVMGGDGTIEAIAPALVRTNTRLGILVGGTQNNLAGCLGIPEDLAAASRIIAKGICQKIDVGQVKSKKKGKRLFFEFVGFGLLAAVLTKRKGLDQLAPHAILKALEIAFSYTKSTITIKRDGKKQTLKNSLMLVAANTPTFGNHFLIAPNASLADGRMDLLTYPGVSAVGLAAYFAEVTDEGKAYGFHDVCYLTRKATIRAKPKQMAIADNRMLGKGSLKIKILKQALTVMVNVPIESLNSPNKPVE